MTQTRKHLQCSLHDLSRGSHSVASDSRWPLLDQRESNQTRVYILRSCALWALRRALVGEKKKGKYVYYDCTGNKGKCPEPYAREEVLEACFADLLKGLVFDDEVMDWIVDALHQSHGSNRSQCKPRLSGPLLRPKKTSRFELCGFLKGQGLSK